MVEQWTGNPQQTGSNPVPDHFSIAFAVAQGYRFVPS